MPRSGKKPISLASRANVLPLHHIYPMMSTLHTHTCLGGSLPQRAVRSTTICTFRRIAYTGHNGLSFVCTAFERFHKLITLGPYGRFQKATATWIPISCLVAGTKCVGGNQVFPVIIPVVGHSIRILFFLLSSLRLAGSERAIDSINQQWALTNLCI